VGSRHRPLDASHQNTTAGGGRINASVIEVGPFRVAMVADRIIKIS